MFSVEFATKTRPIINRLLLMIKRNWLLIIFVVFGQLRGSICSAGQRLLLMIKRNWPLIIVAGQRLSCGTAIVYSTVCWAARNSKNTSRCGDVFMFCISCMWTSRCGDVFMFFKTFFKHFSKHFQKKFQTCFPKFFQTNFQKQIQNKFQTFGAKKC